MSTWDCSVLCSASQCCGSIVTYICRRPDLIANDCFSFLLISVLTIQPPVSFPSKLLFSLRYYSFPFSVMSYFAKIRGLHGLHCCRESNIRRTLRIYERLEMLQSSISGSIARFQADLMRSPKSFMREARTRSGFVRCF